MEAKPPSRKVHIPVGTRIAGFTNQKISTEKNRIGDTFSIEVAEPVFVGGRAVVPLRTVAAVGAGAGTAGALATRGKDFVLSPETKLEFRVIKEVRLFEVVR